MKIFISSLFVLILAFFTSKFKIKVMYLKKDKKQLKIDFNVKLGIYLFGFIKIFSVLLKNDGIHFLFFRISYNRIKFDKNSFKSIKNYSIFNITNDLKLSLESFNLKTEIGISSIVATVLFVVLISNMICFVTSSTFKKINFKKYYYKIYPVYNSNLLEFELKTEISIKIYNLVKTLSKIKKNKITPKSTIKHKTELLNLV